MQKIKDGNPDGTAIDITQLRNGLSYVATKQAILCSVNVLAKRALIARKPREVRNGRNHTPLVLTELGGAYIDSYVTSLRSVLVEEEEIE